MRSTGALLLIVLVACGEGPGSPQVIGEESPCPELPAAWVDAEEPIWPAEPVGELVPGFDDICATPTAPALFGVLNESAAMSQFAEAVGLGVLHRGGEALATFTVTRVAPGTAGLEEGIAASGGTVTEADGIEFAWMAADAMVTVLWLDDRDLVALGAADAKAASAAASAWLGGRGVDVDVKPPEAIPTTVELHPALVAGLPVAGIPSGYVVLPINPMIFAGSDLADAVGIFDEPLDAIGGALVLRDGEVIATAMGWQGKFDGVSTTPRQIYSSLDAATTEGVVAASVTGEDADIVLVGFDDRVAELADAWSAALS